MRMIDALAQFAYFNTDFYIRVNMSWVPAMRPALQQPPSLLRRAGNRLTSEHDEKGQFG